MTRALICLALTLFVCAQAATLIPIPPNQDLAQTVFDLSLESILREEQFKERLPREIFAIEKANFDGKFIISSMDSDRGHPIKKGRRNTYNYYFEVILKTVSKVQYSLAFVAETDLKNTTITYTTHQILATENFGLWPGVTVRNNTDIGSPDYDSNHYINNEFAQKIYTLGMKDYNSFFFKPIGHKLRELECQSANVVYTFLVSLQNQLTGEVHDEVISYYFNNFKVERSETPRIITRRVRSGEQQALINPENIKFDHSTRIAFNPLLTLWNENLLAKMETSAKAQIVREAFLVFGKNTTGRFEFKHSDIKVKITEYGLEYTLNTDLNAAPWGWYRPCHVTLLVDPIKQEAIVSKTHVHSEWIARFEKLRGPPEWIDY